MAVIKDARPPKDASEAWSLMGSVQYSAKFVPNLAYIAKANQEFTRKGVAFKWGAEQQRAFQNLRQLATQAGLGGL